MFARSTLRKRLASIPTIVVHGPWSRAIGFHLLKGPPPGTPPTSLPQPLWPGGAPLNGARFTPKGSFGSLYLAEHPVTALQEVVSIFIPSTAADPITLRTSPWVVVTVEGVLTNVVDLTDSSIQKQLGTTIAELTGDWLYAQSVGMIPPTQLLGQAAYEAGIVGLKYLSVKSVGAGNSLVVFTDNLKSSPANFLEVFDQYSNLPQRLP
jgi:RES domain-containing protein